MMKYAVTACHDGVDSGTYEVSPTLGLARLDAIALSRFDEVNDYRIYEFEDGEIGDIVAIYQNDFGNVSDIFDGDPDNWF